MSGQEHGRSGPPGAPRSTPLLAPARAARLLDDVIFARVVELIDLSGLYDLEEMLAHQLAHLGVNGDVRRAPGAAADEDAEPGRAIARAMIDRALLRLARTSRRWTRAPGSDERCELCGSPCGPEAGV